jgi:hypothetical protein
MRAENYKSRNARRILVSQPVAATPADCAAKLAALGLKLTYLEDVIRAGEQARRLVTKNDPKNAAGTEDYFRRVRTLRDRLIVEEGWTRAELKGLPLVLNPDKSAAIGVLQGDHKTGWVGPYHPKSKRPVGDGKIRLTAQNYQIALFSVPTPADETDLEADGLMGVDTWFLVTKRREKGKSVRTSSELSLPAEVSDDGYIEKWLDRIPLPDITFEGVKPHTPSDDDGSKEYEVEVGEL